MLDKSIYLKGIGILAGVFQNYKISAGLMYSYLRDLTNEEFIKAINEIIKGMTELYPNTNLIALIREKARAIQKKLPGEAWAEVLGAISGIGFYGSPKFSDSLIKKAVNCIGWRHLCLSENIEIQRAHFLKIYESLSKRENYERVINKKSIGFADNRLLDE